MNNSSPALSRAFCVSGRPVPAARRLTGTFDDELVQGRGGAFSPGPNGKLRGDSHTLKQPNGPGLSDNTFSGHAYAEPSRFEQVAGGTGIVLMVLVPLLVLSHGWPLTLLFGGVQ